MAEIRIGISGWRYAGWRGVFYPTGLPQRDELRFASQQLSTIEINGTHYSLQRPESFAAWYAETPPGFVFAIKGSRFITHMKQLNDVEDALANFFAQGVLLLEDKTGPFLWQLPPRMRYSRAKLERFLRALPRDSESALRVARGHDHRVAGRTWLHVEENRPFRHALEVRNESFAHAELIELLRAHDVALVVSDAAGHWPYAEDVTSDFVYVRLHGAAELYVSGYLEEELDAWARRVRAWHGGRCPAGTCWGRPGRAARRGRDVFVYFDNDAKVQAPFDAIALAQRLHAPAYEVFPSAATPP